MWPSTPIRRTRMYIRRSLCSGGDGSCSTTGSLQMDYSSLSWGLMEQEKPLFQQRSLIFLDLHSGPEGFSPGVLKYFRDYRKALPPSTCRTASLHAVGCNRSRGSLLFFLIIGLAILF